MQKTLKRILSIVLTLAIVMAVVPAITISAAGSGESRSVYFTLSNDGAPVIGNDAAETVLGRVPVTVEWFDLGPYGLDQFNRYATDDFENGGGYIDGEVIRIPTVLHLYIRMLEEYYLGGDTLVPWSTPATYSVDLLGNQITGGTQALNITGSSTSMYMSNFWGHDENLMYYVDHRYPLMAAGWGSTADYILLEDGMAIDVAMFSNWSFWMSGAFAFFDQTEYNNIAPGTTLNFETLKSLTIAAGDGSSLPSEPLSGLTTKIYDSNWQELEDITHTVVGGVFSYTFASEGTYYVVALDPNVGTYASETAPAVATVTVGGGGGLVADYSAYPFDNVTLLDETTQLIDITVSDMSVDPWSMGTYTNVPLYTIIVPDDAEYIYVYYPGTEDVGVYCAWYDPANGDYPMFWDSEYVLDQMPDGSHRLKIQLDPTADGSPDVFIMEDSSYAFIAAFAFEYGDITKLGGSTTINVTGVTLDESAIVLERGNTATLEAQITPADANDKRVGWSTSDSTVASVSNQGVVTANKAGTATITATTRDGAYTVTCTITVTDTNAPALVDDYYQITTAAELKWFEREVNRYGARSANAVLCNDIDLSTVCSETLGTWTPIGDYSSSVEYRGTFDGQGYTISNLYVYFPTATVSTSDYYKALFGYCNGATIKNLTVEGSSYSRCRYVAGIVGNAYGGTLIENCHNYVEVTQASTTYIGAAGIVASLINGKVINCSNNATITGTCGSIGGIAGNMSNSSCVITDSYNTGDIIGTVAATSTSYYGIGGILGSAGSSVAGTISNCYNTGTIRTAGSNGIGGIFGINGSAGATTSQMKITNCYNVGTVTTTNGLKLGAFAGVAPVVTNSYFLTGVTGGTDLNITAAVAKTAAEMMATAFVAELNGDGSAFKADAGLVNGGYPVLAWQKSEGASAPAELSATELELVAGSRDFSAATLVVYGDYVAIAWSSSDENVVSVDEDGAVTAIGAGTAVITVVVDGATLTCEVKVYAAGDINKDGAITVVDITLLNNLIKNAGIIDPFTMALADVVADGGLNMQDLMRAYDLTKQAG